MKHILVVEDEPEIRANLQELLQGEGYGVTVAADGAEALHQLGVADPLPDLILLDYQLPVMDAAAFRAAQEEDARLSPVPVFLLTADDYPEVKRIKIGARAYMKKPFDVTKLLAAIEACLRDYK